MRHLTVLVQKPQIVTILLTDKESSMLQTVQQAWQACNGNERIFRMALIKSKQATDLEGAQKIINNLKKLQVI